MRENTDFCMLLSSMCQSKIDCGLLLNTAVKESGNVAFGSGVDAEMAEEKQNGEASEERESSTEASASEEVVNEQELKYWKAVKENPADFTSWTYLLQFVEQEVRRKGLSESFKPSFTIILN